jgi:hypothetical protein
VVRTMAHLYLITSSPITKRCVGASNNIYMAPDPSMATDPTNSNIWIAMPTGLSTGNRMVMWSGQIVCNPNAAPVGHTQVSPEPCNEPPAGGSCQYGTNGQDGGLIIQDEWEPAIAFGVKNSTPTVVAYWYGARDDTNNVKTSVYYWYSENGSPFHSSFTNCAGNQCPAALALPDNIGQTIPWSPMVPAAPSVATMPPRTYRMVTLRTGTRARAW